jgi:hypothetical protein
MWSVCRRRSDSCNCRRIAMRLAPPPLGSPRWEVARRTWSRGRCCREAPDARERVADDLLCVGVRVEVGGKRVDVAYDCGDGRCSLQVTRVTPKRPTLQLSGNARCSRLLQDGLRDGMSGLWGQTSGTPFIASGMFGRMRLPASSPGIRSGWVRRRGGPPNPGVRCPVGPCVANQRTRGVAARCAVDTLPVGACLFCHWSVIGNTQGKGVVIGCSGCSRSASP